MRAFTIFLCILFGFSCWHNTYGEEQYQTIKKEKKKYLLPETDQGHLNQMDELYKFDDYDRRQNISESEYDVCPECYVHGPDSLAFGESGIFETRVIDKEDSIKTVWNIQVPISIDYNQQNLVAGTPFQDVVRCGQALWAVSDNNVKYAEREKANTKWAKQKKIKYADNSRLLWEGQRKEGKIIEAGKEGFTRLKLTFSGTESAMIKIETQPIIPGLDKIMVCVPKYVRLTN